ncbi:unnamed protein product [Hermetia illucens]|uniref:ABC-type xenobiotic transporter n=2 Tax=Hermetia illucens TaxID=343691 RepID=A0A7R8UZB3_HERIL|nr:unnamed protein product [Hermetia illucens]
MVNHPLKSNMKKMLQKDVQEGTPPSVSFISLYQYATNWEKLILVAGLIACSITGLSQAFTALNFCELADAMIHYGSLNETTQQNKDHFMEKVIRFLIRDGLVVVSYLIFKYVAIVAFNYAACNQVLRMRRLFFRAMMNWDMEWYDLHESGELASRINEDLARIEDGIGEKVPMYLHYIVAFVSSLILCFFYGWELTLVCLAPVPISLLILFFLTSRTARQTKAAFNAYAQAGAVAEEVFSAIRTVHAFDGKEKEIERYNEKIANAAKASQTRELYSALLSGLQWTLFCLLNALGTWYGMQLLVKQMHWDPSDIVYTPKTMFIIFYTICVSVSHIALSSIFIESFASAQAAGAKVLHLIKQASKIDPLGNHGLRPATCMGNISFQNIHFQYPSRPDVKILNGFSLSIRRGESVAIVGHSGCGKSTCIQLLQRLYDPSEGEILLDGIEIKSLNVNWLREKIGVVGQEPVLFGTSIYENIRYGRENAGKKDIEEAARVANAHDFIVKLPQGYNTQVGERGAQLSGGQKQRIAIARALVRNPDILLLDEATSALDIKNEAKVQVALERASKGRTTIIVAHRLSTIRNADKIVVLDKGQVVEMGSHNELMMKHSVYYNMVTNQLNKEMNYNSPESPLIITELDEADDESSVHVDETPEKEPPSDILMKPATTLQILKIHPTDWPLLVFGSIGGFLGGATIPLFAVAFGGFLGALVSRNEEELLKVGEKYGIFWLALGLFVGVFFILQNFSLGLAGESLTKYLRSLCFKTMLNQEIGWFDDKRNGTGVLCARLSGETADVHQAMGSRIGNSFMSLGLITIAFLVSLMYKWQMMLIAGVFMPLIYATIWGEKKVRHRETVMKASALRSSTKLVVEVIGNIRTVVALGRQKLFCNKYMDLLIPAAKRQEFNIHIRGICYALTTSLTTMIFLPMIFYGCHLILKGELYFGDAIKIARCWSTVTVMVSNQMAYTPNVQRGLLAAANIFGLLKREPKIVDTEESYRNTKQKSKGNVKFEDVDFSYPTNPEAKILNDLNLDVNQGQNIALVGPSGCGKSTCIQLLQRFYDTNRGKVSVDEEDVRSLTLRNLRLEMGIVSQEASLFNRTIADNIAYGDNTRKASFHEIVEAAKKANIHNFIVTLPEGYETKVGDKGTQLSGGQKQRIAIARALIRNPKILLLDEATSALDIESEKVVQAALDLAKKGRTCITIAHRLATIMDADVIYVLKDGRIVENGSHKELLEMTGIYYELYKSQRTHNAWK